MKTTTILPAALAAVLVAALGGAALAQDAAAQIAARRAFMKGLNAQMQAVRSGDPATARPAAEKVAAGFRAFKAQFPAGSDSTVAPTRATAAVWANNADFLSKVDGAIAAADAMVQASGGTDGAAITASAGGVNCAGCHGAYRGPA